LPINILLSMHNGALRPIYLIYKTLKIVISCSFGGKRWIFSIFYYRRSEWESI